MSDRWNLTALVGHRTRSVAGLQERFADHGGTLSQQTAETLLRDSSGWDSIIDSLRIHSQSTGIALGSMTREDQAMAVTAQALFCESNGSVDSMDVVSYLIAALGSATRVTLDVAIPLVDDGNAVIGGSNAALRCLVDSGILVEALHDQPSDSEGAERYAVSALVRAHLLGRRKTAIDHGTISDLLPAFAERLVRRTLASHPLDPASAVEALRQLSVIQNRQGLAAMWASCGTGLFSVCFYTTVEAFSTLQPATVESSWALKEARGFATLAASEIERGTPVAEVVRQLPLVIPSAATDGQTGNAPLSPDDFGTVGDIITCTLSSMVSEFLQSHPLDALNVAEAGRRALARHSTRPSGPGLGDVRFFLQRSIIEATISDHRSAAQTLRCALRDAQSAGSHAEYLVPEIEGRLAFVLASLGEGASADRNLAIVEGSQVADELSDVVRATIDLARGIRALDRLDYPSARAFLESAATMDQELEIALPLLKLRGTLGLYDGRAFEEKLAIEYFLSTYDICEEQFQTILDELESLLIGLELALGDRRITSVHYSQKRDRGPSALLANAQTALARGEFDIAYSDTNRLLADSTIPVRAKASALALSTSAAFEAGLSEEMTRHFQETLTSCRFISTLLPIAQMPSACRNALIDAHRDGPYWKALVVAMDSASEAEMLELVITAPDVLQIGTSVVLTQFEIGMLRSLDEGHSIAAIARSAGMAQGTIKNKLSQMYKKIGVRTKREALHYAKRHLILDE